MNNRLRFITKIIGITIIPIVFNLNNYIFGGGSPNVIQCIASISCIIGWFLLSMHSTKSKRYLFFIFTYWGIDIVLNILIYLLNVYTSIGLMMIAPLKIWFDAPFDGLALISKDITIIMPIVMLINCLVGYLVGVKVSKMRAK